MKNAKIGLPWGLRGHLDIGNIAIW